MARFRFVSSAKQNFANAYALIHGALLLGLAPLPWITPFDDGPGDCIPAPPNCFMDEGMLDV